MKLLQIKQEDIIKNLGFNELNDIQLSTIKAYEKNSNLLLLAPTGSGKTVAFLLSIISRLTNIQGIQALIIVPTRELVIQIENVIKQMKLTVKVNSCYGGHVFSVERNNFSNPPAILIGTPGRIQDHLQKETFNPNTISQIVFDEFDKSLEFGFSSQMEFIFRELKNIKYQILVSATHTIEIPKYLNIDNVYKINYNHKSTGALSLKQLIVPNEEKTEALVDFFYSLNKDENVLVFVNHREACNRICEHLKDLKASFSIYHGGLEQEQRELELIKFRNGSTNVLIATDIASRGIDIPELDYVVHYQLPQTESIFTHRNGRTARMKYSGTSILLRTNNDRLPEYLNSEPEVYEFIKNKEIAKPQWTTLYIGKGKKDKINKIDIVGFFMQFDFVGKTDIGLIEVKDFSAYVAIKSNKIKILLSKIDNKKLKNKTIKISLAK